MTSQVYQMSLFEKLDTLTLSAEDFRAKLSQLLESEEDSKIQEELSSLKLQDSQVFSNLNIFSARTLKDSLITTKEERSKQSSTRLMNWGMMWNGKCLTAKISVSHKTENVCILSDILEEQVDDQYFLSSEKTERLIKQISSKSEI